MSGLNLVKAYHTFFALNAGLEVENRVV